MRRKIIITFLIIFVILCSNKYSFAEDKSINLPNQTSSVTSKGQEEVDNAEGGTVSPDTKEDFEKQEQEKAEQKEWEEKYKVALSNTVNKKIQELRQAREATKAALEAEVRKTAKENNIPITDGQVKEIVNEFEQKYNISESLVDHYITSLGDSLGFKTDKEAIQEYEKKVGLQVDKGMEKLFDMAIGGLSNEISKINDSVPILGSIAANIFSRYANAETEEMIQKASDSVKEKIGVKTEEIVKDNLDRVTIDEAQKSKNKKTFDWESESYYAVIDAVHHEALVFVDSIMKDINKQLADAIGVPAGKDLANTITGWFGNTIGAWLDDRATVWTNTVKENKKKQDETTSKSEAEKAKEAEAIEDGIKDGVDEIKKANQEDIEKKANEAAKAQRAALVKKYVDIRNEAYDKIADYTGQIAKEYVDNLYDQLMEQVELFEGNLGKVGNTMIASMSKQLKNWLGENLKNEITNFMKNFLFGQDNAYKWSTLDINLRSLLVDFLTTSISNSKIADLVGVAYEAITYKGAIIGGYIPFEKYHNTYFQFGITGGLMIPSINNTIGIGTKMTTTTGFHPGQFLFTEDSTVGYAANHIPRYIPLYTTANIGTLPGLSMSVPYIGIEFFEPILGDYSANTTALYTPASPFYIGLGIPYLSDTGYIMCEMMKNDISDSYVQRALSWSGVGGTVGTMYQGVKFNPTFESSALNAEAAEFALFTVETALHGGYKNAIKDLTTEAVAMYNRDSMDYILGPFKVDYIRSFSHEITRGGKAEFGLMVDANIYDNNGNLIPQYYWTFIWSDDTKKDRRMWDDDYLFPYPGEEFYIALMNYEGNNMQAISKIELEYKEMQVSVAGTVMEGTYTHVNIFERIRSWTTGTPPILWSQNWICSGASYPQVAQPLASVLYAKKFYLHHVQTIELHRTDNHGGYETATFTTTSNVTTSGITNISTAYGGMNNSELAKTLKGLDDNYAQDNMYSSTGSTFFDSVTNVYQIYNDAKNDTPLLSSLQAVLEMYGKDDWAKYVGLAADLTSSNRYSKFDKYAVIIGMFDKTGKFTSIAQAIAAVQDIKSGDYIHGIKQVTRVATAFGLPADSGYLDALTMVVTTIEDMEELTPEERNATIKALVVSGSKRDEIIKKYPKVKDALDDLTTVISNDKKTYEILNKVTKIADKVDKSDDDKEKGNDLSNALEIAGTVADGIDADAASSIKQLERTVEQIETIKNTVPDITTGGEVDINKLGNAISAMPKSTYRDEAEKILRQAKTTEEYIKQTENKLKEAQTNLKPFMSAYNGPSDALNNADTGTLESFANSMPVGMNKDYVTKQVSDLKYYKAELNNLKSEKKSHGENATNVLNSYLTSTQNINNSANEIANIVVQTNNTMQATGASLGASYVSTYRKSSQSDEIELMTSMLSVVEDLNAVEINSLSSAISRAYDKKEAMDILDVYNQRKSLRTDAERKEAEARPFEETLEINKQDGRNAVLFDDTTYTEFNPKFTITNIETPNEVYWSNDHAMGLTIGVAGVVWKDSHSGLELDYDSVRSANANGELERGIEGVKVTLIDKKTGEVGLMYNASGRKVAATTYTDEGGYYHIEKVLVGEYDVDFEYDGQTYKTTELLAGGNTSDYIFDPDQDLYANNSKAVEDPTERIDFNNKFNEIIGPGSTKSEHGYAIGTDGKITPLTYNIVEGESRLVTLDSAGHVLPQFAMHARTSTNGLTYPVDDSFTMENHDVTLILNGNKYTFYSAGEYMYHINLGLVERTKIDFAVTQDVYETTTTVNQKKEDYIYNARGILGIYDVRLKETRTYNGFQYTRELYNADYKFRVDDYNVNELNRTKIKQANTQTETETDKEAEVYKIMKIKSEDADNDGIPDLEEKVFVTYKIDIINQSILQSGTINELADYFDPTYQLVDSDRYLNIQNSEGKPEWTLVAKQSYYEKSNGETGKLVWTENSKYGNRQISSLKDIYTRGLENIILKSGEKISVYITFEVDKSDPNNGISLGNKRNVTEINNYSSFAFDAVDKTFPEGLIDKDSEPGIASPDSKTLYQDSTDEAPEIEIKLYETDGRIIDGFVWDDDRTKTITRTNQKVGNGYMQDNEERINGVRVQLIEKVDDGDNEYEYVWKEMYTGEDEYSYVQHDGDRKGSGGNVSNYGSIIGDTSLGSVEKGQYKFNDYIAGNFIVRFIYGDTQKTYLTEEKEEDGIQGQNPISYNGHDFKSTTYQLGTNINDKWYDLGNHTQNQRRISDAKDDEVRRLKMTEYSKTITNGNAEVLASFDSRKGKNLYDDERNYYDSSKQQELRDETWMFADTARFNVEVEYNKTRDNGLEKPSYRIQNIDFGLQERPETRIELNKEITGIKVTLASGDVIIDTAQGINRNVAWNAKRKTSTENNNKGTSYVEYNKDKGITQEYKDSNNTHKYRTSKIYKYSQGDVHIYMDEEIMRGANIEISYRITISNESDIDYLGSDGSLGVAYYQGKYGYNDTIVTTSVDKIVDYVDNSIVFRKINSEEWDLVENRADFLQGIKIDTNDNNSDKNNNKLANEDVLDNMKKIGYLNPSLVFTQTRPSKTKEEADPITQVIVTDASKANLKPGETTTVNLVLVKTLSSLDDSDDLSYRNIAEILQISNDAGRRDMDAIPGNQDPDVRSPDRVYPMEYDSDLTERVFITPPTGENKAYYFVLGTVVFAILIVGIVLIKRKVLDTK